MASVEDESGESPAVCRLPKVLFVSLLEWLDTDTLLALKPAGLDVTDELLCSHSAESSFWEPYFQAEMTRLRSSLITKATPTVDRFLSSVSDAAIASLLFGDGSAEAAAEFYDASHPCAPLEWSNANRLRWVTLMSDSLSSLASLAALSKDDTEEAMVLRRRIPWKAKGRNRRVFRELAMMCQRSGVALMPDDWQSLWSAYRTRTGIDSPESLTFSAKLGDIENTNQLPSDFRTGLFARLRFGDLKGVLPYSYAVYHFSDGMIDFDRVTIRVVIPASAKDSPYHGLTDFSVTLEFPKDYPFKPPRMTATSPPVRHLMRCSCQRPLCWCIPCFKDEWHPVLTTANLCFWFLRLFAVRTLPECKYSVGIDLHSDAELHKAYVHDPEEYDRLVQASFPH